jgi:hypothetical protein
MKKKLIIGSSILLIIASVIMHFFLTDTNADLLDFIIGAIFGIGLGLPLILLNDKLKD